MGLFDFGRTNLPPTKYGYQPPKGAIAKSWECTKKECETFKYEPDLKKWPKNCPACGSLIASCGLDEPWEHEARRVEIDWKLKHPDENSTVNATTKMDDLLWHFEDALKSEDSKKAEEQKNAIFNSLDPNSASIAFSLFSITSQSLNHNRFDLAADILMQWHNRSKLKVQTDDKMWVFNGKHLTGQLIAFLEHPHSTTTSHYHSIFNLLENVITSLGDEVLSMNEINRYLRIKHRIENS